MTRIATHLRTLLRRYWRAVREPLTDQEREDFGL